MGTIKRKTIEFSEGWEFMMIGITKITDVLKSENPEQQIFCSEEWMMLYTTVDTMCSQRPPHDYSEQLYHKYGDCFQDYIVSSVLPSLGEKHGELLLREFVHSWLNHKIMMKWLSRFFNCLDRHYITRWQLPSLKEVGLNRFRDLVYEKLKEKLNHAVRSLNNREREGEQIDRALVNYVDAISQAIEAEASSKRNNIVQPS